ncbi:MAG: hypothetical protein R3321_07845, partial [Nitrososphaeraceae archaeon]|nr:hypothetical protein [Nitrososphaeraceae archaeon]
LILQSESFVGITDNSQFVYEQEWTLTALIRRELLPVDPCIRRGFCGLNLDKDVLLTLPRGSVIDLLGRIYTFNPTGDLLFPDVYGNIYLDEVLILEADQDVLPGGYNSNDYLVSMHIIDSNGEVIDTKPAYLTKFKLLRLELHLYRNKIYDIAQFDSSVLNKDRTPFREIPPIQKYQFARTLYDTYFYFDPTNPNAQKDLLEEGTIFLVRPNVTLTINNVEYAKAYLLDGSEGYVLTDIIVLIDEPIKLETEC